MTEPPRADHPQDSARDGKKPAVQLPLPRFIPNAEYIPPPSHPAAPQTVRFAPLEPPKHRLRNGLLGVGGLSVLLIAIGTAATGSSNTASTKTSASPSAQSTPPGAPAAAASPAEPDCATQVQDWYGHGAATQLNTLASDISTFGQAAAALGTDLQIGASPTAEEPAVQSDAASVQTDAQALQAGPPPICAPGLRSDVEAAALYYSISAIDATNGLNQLSSSNTTAAAGDVQASRTAINKGNVKIRAARRASRQ